MSYASLKMSQAKAFLTAGLLLTLVSACNGGGDGASGEPHPSSVLPGTSQSDPKNPPISKEPTYSIDVMVFNGTGVSTSDWQTTEQIVKSHGWSYRLVNSEQLNAMTLDEIAAFGVMIVPGGSGGTITRSLTAETQLRVRKAVRDRGVGYVGFCAGAWVAVGPEADTDGVASYGIAVAEGDVLPYYYPNGTTAQAVMAPVTFADQSMRYLVWWGGPATPEWRNGVVARYATGDPAISQTWSGKGYVVISGPHPEAPQGWRETAGYDSDGLDYDIAIDMITAALNKTSLRTF